MIYLKNVTTILLHDALCNGCGRCLEVCPREVFQMLGKKVRILDRDRCLECGACAENCLTGALSVSAGVGCAQAMINGIVHHGNPDQGACDCDSSAR